MSPVIRISDANRRSPRPEALGGLSEGDVGPLSNGFAVTHFLASEFGQVLQLGGEGDGVIPHDAVHAGRQVGVNGRPHQHADRTDRP